MSLVGVEGVTHRYPTSRSDLPVLRDVSLQIEERSVVAVVGESGCGKTTLGRLVAGLFAPWRGRVSYEGSDIWSMAKADREVYRRSVQLVHQDPFSSLNPGLTVEETLKAGLLRHGVVPRRQVRQEVLRLLDMVGLEADGAFLGRYPHQLSGGQRQRLVIARAMALRPRLVVADEAVSMLDVSIRVAVLDLLLRMHSEQGVAYLFISHDLGVVRYFAGGGRIVVMFFGVVVEEGPAEEVIWHPRHPYTFLLVEAIPVPDPRKSRRRRGEVLRVAEERITGEASASGCVFCNRCPYAEERCREETPPLVAVGHGEGHRAACWFPERVPEVARVVRAGAQADSVLGEGGVEVSSGEDARSGEGHIADRAGIAGTSRGG